MRKILVTGALGQVGSELVPALRARYGKDAVVASDLRMPPAGAPVTGPFEQLDTTQARDIRDVVRRHQIDTVYHLAAILSATAEEKPHVAWNVNMGGLYRLLEIARQNGCAVFVPSSIGAFGPGSPRDNTPQVTVQRPNTMYGVTKVSGELLCDYYATRFGLDTRGVRYPGLISYVAPPGGGTTDYAVEIFYQALRYKHYHCPLRPDTRLDMMYMPDAVAAAIDVMEADPKRLIHRNAFNVTAMSFTPEELTGAIREHIPDLVVEYRVDPARQAIADSWPRSLDDSAARAEWDWEPRWDLPAMTIDMLQKLEARLSAA